MELHGFVVLRMKCQSKTGKIVSKLTLKGAKYSQLLLGSNFPLKMLQNECKSSLSSL